MLLLAQVAGKFYVMQLISNFLLLLLAVLVILCSCDARSTIDGSSKLVDNEETLVSAGEKFEMGFFSDDRDQLRRFVGIWYYNMSPRTVVWVANWNRPIPVSRIKNEDISVVVEDGNLKVYNSNSSTPYFSTVLDSASNRRVELLDTGNLVLVDESGARLWQSFLNPTDTFLPGMKMGMGFKLTDSRSGKYTFQMGEGDNNTYAIFETGVDIPYWKGSVPSGISGTSKFSKMPAYLTYLLSNFNESDVKYSVEGGGNSSNNISKHPPIDFSSYVNGNRSVKSTRLLMNSSGEIQFYFWNEGRWSLIWSAPKDTCDMYRGCGKFGICNSKQSAPCRCLPGYKLDTPENILNPFSGGCSRTLISSCKENNVQHDTFLDLTSMNFGSPDWSTKRTNTSEDCRRLCLRNCTCQAYTYHDSGCWIWFSNIYNLQENYTDGLNISVRVGISPIEVATPGTVNTETAPSRNQRTLVISISLVLGVIILCGISYIIYQNRRAARSKAREIVLGKAVGYLPRRDSSDEDFITENDKKRIDVPFFSLNSILVATENFSNASKLGRGGFGPVYKGKFLGGRDMAVKRLSSNSGQGVEEFKTEVMLIAKLQHRNLVRLLGYCIEENEKILLYEYMPNKSLDTFLFDHASCRLLDWRTRFEIILGIARGLLYLHQDSRLRVIHRDLKTSNILLDEEMNAKISDFGLARIVQGKTTEANTNKVVGTYGYMSPEYALEGLFSIKSDVFAFGVVLLEIISGKRNMELFEDANLIGYVWRLWMKDRALDMMDQTIVESCDEKEVIKCVNVALLCVQEDPADRPTMSNVVFMLGGESMTLPRPNQPAFVTRRNSAGASTSSSSSKLYSTSNNELTITQEEGR
ncbi:hypothetical protein HAX54_035481 [Datura stramonium]|uniref:Receptor-like serine/threonine-protein kinase n=1 Tax=Datura stramonium TaxID=4076 RepID=A0ABS8VJ63_DATST|nr:hypothetical protein [Datura stramonium]